MTIGSRRATLVVVVAAVLLLLSVGDFVWHSRIDRTSGKPTAMDRGAIKADLFTACDDKKINPEQFTLGAMVDDGQGNRLVVASTPKTIAACGIQPFGNGSGVGDFSEATLRDTNRVIGRAGGVGDEEGFLGYGRTLPEAALVEIFLPDGKQVLSDAASETFAYFVRLPHAEVQGLSVRVTNQVGAVIYSGPLP